MSNEFKKTNLQRILIILLIIILINVVAALGYVLLVGSLDVTL